MSDSNHINFSNDEQVNLPEGFGIYPCDQVTPLNNPIQNTTAALYTNHHDESLNPPQVIVPNQQDMNNYNPNVINLHNNHIILDDNDNEDRNINNTQSNRGGNSHIEGYDDSTPVANVGRDSSNGNNTRSQIRGALENNERNRNLGSINPQIRHE